MNKDLVIGGSAALIVAAFGFYLLPKIGKNKPAGELFEGGGRKLSRKNKKSKIGSKKRR